jgi:phage terminase large subunit
MERLQLIPKQNRAVYYLKDSKTEEIIYGGAAGGGKSALGCLWLIEQCQTYPGSRWLMGRAKLKTLKETTLNTFFELSSKLGISNQFNFNAQQGIIYWSNGSEIILKDLFLYPSDPEFDQLGSLEISGAFVDEVSQVVYKAWQIVKSRIRYKLNEFGIIPKILGSCNPTKKWVYKEFYKPFKEKSLRSDRAFIQALPTDNPHLPKSYLQSLLSLDETSKQRLYYGNWEFDDDPAKLINYESILDLWRNEYVSEGEKYITADIARFGSDKGVIMLWSGYRVLDVITLDHSSVTNTAQTIRDLANKYQIPTKNIIADEDGVGGGVVDILGCKGFVNGSRALEEERKQVQYSNLKTQCYFKLAEKINNGQIYLTKPFANISEKLIQELEQVKRDKLDQDGKLILMSKEKVKEAIGRSPDFSDALMMRVWFDIAPRLRSAFGIAT